MGLGQMLASQKLTMWLFTLCTHLPGFLYLLLISEQIFYSMGFPGGSDNKESTCNVGDNKESTCNVGDLGLISGSGRSPGEGIGYLLQYSWASLVVQLVKNPPAM